MRLHQHLLVRNVHPQQGDASQVVTVNITAVLPPCSRWRAMADEAKVEEKDNFDVGPLPCS